MKELNDKFYYKENDIEVKNSICGFCNLYMSCNKLFKDDRLKAMYCTEFKHEEKPNIDKK